jgi:hypothetical protein
LDSARNHGFSHLVSLGVLRQAAEAASAANGPLHGYPPWLIVAVGAVIAAVLLWIFAKLVKWTLWIVIALVLVGGIAMAVKMFMETPAGPAPTVAPAPATPPRR